MTTTTTTTTTNTTALTPAQEVRELWTLDQMSLIRQTIAPGISLSELHLFAMICKRTGLDPFTKQIYAIKRGDRMTVQTGIDGYRVLAVRTGELAGIDDAIYDAEDGDHPSRASVTVWRLVQGHRVSFTATARWNEYVQNDRNGKPTSMWAKMPYLMLAKCAESLALRKAFPAELSGIYTAEEMAQAENDAPALPQQPRQTAQTTVETPVMTSEDAPAVSSPRHEQPAPVQTPQQPQQPQQPPAVDNSLSLTHASALDQKKLYGQLAARRLHENGGFLRNVTGRDVDVEKLRDGRSDLSLVELAKVSERLTHMPTPAGTAQANGKAGAAR